MPIKNMDAGNLDVFCSVPMSRRTVKLGTRPMKTRKRTLPGTAAAARVGAKREGWRSGCSIRG